MARVALNKDRWTLTFDPNLKKRVLKEAKKLHIYPVQLLEALVRERLDQFGFQSVENSIHYVNAIRKENSKTSDKSFLSDLKKWSKL